MEKSVEKFVAVQCGDCGIVKQPDTSGRTRCDSCGQFAEVIEDYCLDHDVHVGRLTGYDECPICREEQRIHQQEMEMHQRRADPSMHTSVDARRF
jgi:hypothetical protein